MSIGFYKKFLFYFREWLRPQPPTLRLPPFPSGGTPSEHRPTNPTETGNNTNGAGTEPRQAVHALKYL